MEILAYDGGKINYCNIKKNDEISGKYEKLKIKKKIGKISNILSFLKIKKNLE